MNNQRNPNYRSYLLRLWQDTPDTLWRASVQCVQTNEITRFADLDDLVAFLWKQTAMNLMISPTIRSETEHQREP